MSLSDGGVRRTTPTDTNTAESCDTMLGGGDNQRIGTLHVVRHDTALQHFFKMTTN